MNADTEITDLVKASECGEITLWSEDKKNQFVATFEARVRVARYVLHTTAGIVLERAHEQQYVGNKCYCMHAQSVKVPRVVYDARDCHTGYGYAAVGGRTLEELGGIAKERADLILKELPPLKTAVQVLDPVTAANLGRRDALSEKAEALNRVLEEVSEPISILALDSDMTIGDFRKLVKERQKKQREMVATLKDVVGEATVLEIAINKALYAGLPGLADAIVDVVKSHVERATALDAMSRRVAEQVKFGDSDAALELLRHFETDEVTISGDVREQFQAAMEKLKLRGVKKGKK